MTTCVMYCIFMYYVYLDAAVSSIFSQDKFPLGQKSFLSYILHQ